MRETIMKYNIFKNVRKFKLVPENMECEEEWKK